MWALYENSKGSEVYREFKNPFFSMEKLYNWLSNQL